LASAQRKTRSFLAQISRLEGSEFPHPDARDALDYLKQKFVKHEQRLNSMKPHSLALDNACFGVIRDVLRHTKALGLILRATNVRNPFEIYYPLKALVQKIVPNAKLILSSEWDWTPFTLPIGHMENFIFIGIPATEFDNVLVTPLAGHEFGHSAWVRLGINQAMGAAVSELLGMPEGDEAEADDNRTREEIEAEEALKAERQHKYELALAQLEEIFCDLVGLYVFAESYLFAVAHTLAPGGLYRDQRYPDAVARINHMKAAVDSWKNIEFDHQIFARWRHSKPSFCPPSISEVDSIVGEIVPDLIKLTAKRLEEKEIDRADPGKVTDVTVALSQRVPFDSEARLSEILCAGWKVLRDEGGLGAAQDRAACESLNEVILKSIEVSEFYRRIKHAGT
jgi:hypothetical protein